MTAVANLLSADLDELTAALAVRLGASIVRPAALADFRDGRAGIALICGLAYTLLHDAAPDRFEAVAAPVVDDHRGGGAPVYFSDIVVPAVSDARALVDLAGRRFACNETVSFSGYRALGHELAAWGLGRDWFGEVVYTGAHHASLAAVMTGAADAAAIDSQVLLLARRRDPRLDAGIRVIRSLGPYPAPPLAINRDACDLPAAALRERLGRLPPACLERAGIRCWQPVDDADYDVIRAAARDRISSAGARLPPPGSGRPRRRSRSGDRR